MQPVAGMKPGRLVTLVTLVALVVVGACAGDDFDSHTVEIGECSPPAGSVDVPTTVVALGDSCLTAPLDGLAVVETITQWDALFSCPTPVPAAFDLARERIAVAHVECRPIEARFTVAAGGQIIVGIYQRVSGACIDPPLVMSLPRAATPVRLARCQESCEGNCPPVP